MVVVGVGFVVAWTGYLLFTYGYTLVKGKSSTISDLALPSHRQAAVNALKQG